MTHKALLTNRTYNLNEGKVNWYSSLYFLKEFPSVKKVDFFEMCSSAGDWSGYIVQTIKNTSYLIPFNQENNYPRYGFTVYTGNVLASWNGDISEDGIFEILTVYMEL